MKLEKQKAAKFPVKDREAIKKGYNDEVEGLASKRQANEKAFGNPYGPDGGESFRQKEKPPELAPLGGYDEKIVSGARGGNPDAKRGEEGYMEKETVAVGPMTNRPAASTEEYNKRMKAYAEEGVRQKERNAQAAQNKRLSDLEKQKAAKFPVKDRGLPTERGYTGRRVA